MTWNQRTSGYLGVDQADTERPPLSADEHLPDRPSWDCRTCGALWPCEPARERLAAEYQGNRVALAIYLWAQLEAYAGDAGPGPLVEAHERFVSWTG